MTYKAVVFDLFGTLVPSFTPELYNASLKNMAEFLGADYGKLRQAWHDSVQKRNTGAYRTPADVIDALCDILGVDPDENRRQDAVLARSDFMRKTLVPRSDALDVLATVRDMGMKIALISNCSPDAEDVWAQSAFPPYFDVAVLSSAVGLKKPDPAIYRLALDGLGVEPETCLYVGDGDSNELTGALEAGMHPVMIRVPAETNSRFDSGRQKWDGPVIASLSEIPGMLK